MPRASDSEPPLSIGSTYAPGDCIAGRYQLIRVLEQGGMGVVWVAHHLALDVHVALKLVRPEAGSEQAERLLIEARAAARLDHPAILRVLDVGETSMGDPFLVMELLEGECLADVLEREKSLDPVTTVRTMLPIADALSALHGKGIVHRDVKPENIFLAQSDSGRWQPKLIDFGVARLQQRDAERITRRGMAVGTPLYMSPEQLKGEETDARSDVWALSVVLYEVMTGEVPFDAETNVLLLMALLDGDARPLSDHGVGDDALWAILRRGLTAKEARWPSVRALGEALARWLWARGVRHDIAGVRLHPAWLDERELGEPSIPLPAARAAPVRAPVKPSPPRVAMTKELVARASLATTTAVARPPRSAPTPAPREIERRTPGLAQSITVPPREAGRSRRRLLLGAAAAALVASLIAAAWIDRAAPVASDKSDAGQPTPMPTPTPTAPTPTAPTLVVTSASAPGAATAPPPRPAARRPRPPAQPTALPPGLKDPFR